MIRIDRTHGGNFAREVLDFSVSVNPLGPPRAALDAYHAAIAEISSYPPPYPHRLEAALARWLGVEPQCVLAGNGSTQLIYLLARVLKPRSPAIVIPTFSEIANSLILQGIRPGALTATAAQDFRLDHEAAIKCVHGGADAIFIGRPNSPTGTILPIEQAAELAGECERCDAWCIFDEAFIDFVSAARSCSELRSNRKVIVLRSLTKIFAIPGLRVGFLIAHPEVTAQLRAAQEPWSINLVADWVTRACVEIAESFVSETRDFVSLERSRVSDELSKRPGLRVFPSVANFMMVQARNEAVAGAFGKHLLDRGIGIRDLRGLPGCEAGFYRIGIRSKSDNDRLLDAAASWKP